MHESYLKFGGYRYLKLSLALIVLSTAAYVIWSPPAGGNGGTWVGYGLGGLCAFLILWLTAFGMRKRSYKAKGYMLREWLSAHVYLGLALVFLVPLHSGFQFGWNVHTLLYVVMCAVVVSGIAGVLLYGTVPLPMTQNRPGEKLAALLEQIAGVDSDCKEATATLPDEFARAVLHSIDRTRIGGGIRAQLSGAAVLEPTRTALQQVRDNARNVPGEARERVKRLMGLLAVKQELLEKVRRDVRYKALLDFWLVLHVPLAIATVAGLVVHVVVVFYYR